MAISLTDSELYTETESFILCFEENIYYIYNILSLVVYHNKKEKQRPTISTNNNTHSWEYSYILPLYGIEHRYPQF